MADKYINETGLQAIKTWIVDRFTNKIEKIKVNGTEQTPDSEKAVDLTVPTLYTDNVGGFTLTDPKTKYEVMFEPSGDKKTLGYYVDGIQDFNIMHLATTDYADENGGKIDEIYINTAKQPITNKKVYLRVDTIDVAQSNEKVTWTHVGDEYSFDASLGNSTNGATFEIAGTQTELVSKYYTDNTFRTEAQVQQAIDDALADITGIDFQVVDTLPATGTKGVIYLLANSSASPNSYDEYIWVTPTGGTAHYEKIGTTDVDLSDYWTSVAGHSNSLVAMTVSEINAILNA